MDPPGTLLPSVHSFSLRLVTWHYWNGPMSFWAKGWMDGWTGYPFDCCAVLKTHCFSLRFVREPFKNVLADFVRQERILRNYWQRWSMTIGNPRNHNLWSWKPIEISLINSLPQEQSPPSRVLLIYGASSGAFVKSEIWYQVAQIDHLINTHLQ